MDGFVEGTDIANSIVQGGLWARVASTEETVHDGEGVACAGVFWSEKTVVVVCLSVDV
jgi:hypothetical protein